MRISVFGLGYVGCVCLGCFAELGYEVIGVDINQKKVDLINNGQATIHEEKINELIKKNHQQGRIRATISSDYAVQNSDVSLICVGTPTGVNGHLDMGNIYRVSEEIGSALKLKDDYHVIVIRSTVLPGSNEKVGEIISQQCKKARNADFAVVSNPEFLREATAVDDFFNPEITVIASDSEKGLAIMRTLYRYINTTVHETEIPVAELIKYVNNSYHALKVAFANEIGRICKVLSIDSHEVMKTFCADRKLNISSYYFKPGFAYGGSCLPKDLKALNTLSHDNYLSTPVINSIDLSNRNHIDYAFNEIEKYGKKNVAVLGLSFKPGTDDLRNSPTVELVERLLGKGYNVVIYDREVSYSNLMGQNKEYIESTIPHLEKLLHDDIELVIDRSDVIIIFKAYKEIIETLTRRLDKQIIDLVRIPGLEKHALYEGLCW